MSLCGNKKSPNAFELCKDNGSNGCRGILFGPNKMISEIFRRLDSWKYDFEQDKLDIQDFYHMAAGFKIICKILKQSYCHRDDDFTYHRIN